MDVCELRERIVRWKNLHTEFKEWPLHPDDLAATIVAFANTDGGQLILGVADDRSITGVEDTDRASRDVDNVAYNNCEPPVTIIQEVLRLDDEDRYTQPARAAEGGRAVLVVHIPKGDMRPYRTNRGVYYVKTSSGRRQASREELLRAFQETDALSYDETPFIRLDLGAISLDELNRYLDMTGQKALGADLGKLLVNWGLVVNGHPTVAGIVLFGHEPQRHLPHAQIVAARFPGSNGSAEPGDRKDLSGPLLDVIDQAERFLDLHLRTRHTIKGFAPERKPELPKEALREAIVNAVAHRDYTVQGPVRLFVFDDRVEIHTPGKPPNTVDEGAMRAGVHVVRNPRIYTRLADAGLVTKAGTGVRRMICLVREALGQDIRISISDSETVFTIPRRPWAGRA